MIKALIASAALIIGLTGPQVNAQLFRPDSCSMAPLDSTSMCQKLEDRITKLQRQVDSLETHVYCLEYGC